MIDDARDSTASSTAQRPREQGSSTVELAVATPLLGLLLMLVVQFALWAHATHIAQAAANAAVQTTRAYGSSATAGHTEADAVLDRLAGTLLTDRQVSVTRGADTATVTIDGKAITVLPGLNLPVRASVTAPREKVPGTP